MALDAPEIIPLSQKNAENYPLIEPLRPEHTSQLLVDIDDTILDPIAVETPERVTIKVDIINEFLIELAQKTDNQVLFSLLSKKNAEIFFDPNRGIFYSQLLNIQSVRKGSIDGKSCWATMALPHSGTELGVITRIENKLDPKNPILVCDPSFSEPRKLIEDLEQILKDHLIFSGEKQRYQLEEGNLIYVAVQLLGGRPMPLAQKKEVISNTKAILKRLNRQDLLDAFEFSDKENDVDITLPNVKAGKTIGVQADIDSKRYQGYKWYSEKNQVIFDDSWNSADEAAKKVLEGGGRAITFANGDQELINLISQYPNGFVSAHKSFMGFLDGIHWLATGQPMPQEKVKQIERRLKTAEIIRAFKDTVEVSTKSIALFAILSAISPLQYGPDRLTGDLPENLGYRTPRPSEISSYRNIFHFVAPFTDIFFKGWFKWYPKKEELSRRNLNTEFIKSAMLAINPVLTSIILNSGWQPEIQVAAMAGLLISNTTAFYLLRRREQAVAEKF
jgi:hypothetical protein